MDPAQRYIKLQEFVNEGKRKGFEIKRDRKDYIWIDDFMILRFSDWLEGKINVKRAYYIDD
jgi:hypothetical protein